MTQLGINIVFFVECVPTDAGLPHVYITVSNNCAAVVICTVS